MNRVPRLCVSWDGPAPHRGVPGSRLGVHPWAAELLSGAPSRPGRHTAAQPPPDRSAREPPPRKGRWGRPAWGLALPWTGGGGAMKDVGGSESLSVPSSPSLRPPSVSPRGPARVPDARAGEGDPADLPRSAPPPAASSPAQQESGSARGSRRSWTGSSAALTPYSRREEGTCSPFQRPGRLLGPLTHRAGSSTRTEREEGGLAPEG